MSVGWIIVSFFTLVVGLGMAEIVSAVPTSGYVQNHLRNQCKG